MANRVYIIPRRNDLEGIGVQLTDLWPNTSQKNSVLDGEGQTHYVGSCPDAPGATIVSGTAYVSGSKSTSLTVNPVIDDTTGGGNDCYAPATTTLGLAAYLRDRVQKVTNGSFLTFANANTIAANIRTVAEAGTALTLAAINAIIAAEDAGSSLDGDPSFGTVEDILRILSGETYVSPQYTTITSAVPTFINEAARDVLVAAQVTPVNGGITFVAKGHFLTSLETGYIGRPTLAKTGILLASLGAGQLYHGKTTSVPILNPRFTYGTGGTALDIAGTVIPVTGLHVALAVYDHLGNAL
jgi:hypothetical protein